ncbi:MAG: hypothetical protein LBB59_02630 [Campylobacteraceae bacterium]|jgi:hypothetical protein|nr:hypothetical protein [Campylobacteraceae bacterium]
MKKLLFILILLFSANLYASITEIDERKNDIYYANGVLNTKEQVWASLDIIKDSVVQNIYNNNETAMFKETHFDVLYNESNGMFWDLLEAFQQKRVEHKYYWLAVDTISFPSLRQ